MKKRYLIPALLLAANCALGQSGKTAKADQYFDTYQYEAAAKAYEKVVAKEPENAAAILNLVKSYIKLDDAEKANNWLDKLATTELSTGARYREAAALLATRARYQEATKLYSKAVAANDTESIKWLQAYQNLPAFYEDSLLYTINRATFNSSYSDFSPAFYGSGVVFSSSRSNADKANQPGKNYAGFIDLFYAVGAANPEPFSKELNSKYHEGPLTFNATQDTVYFTRSNVGKHSVFNKEGINHLKVYMAVLQNGTWQQIQELPFNNDNYSVGHPALAGSNVLYFASNMPGGFGGTDLYKSVKVNGVWQAPLNLGPEINTVSDEMFPFVDEKGRLYFASNGHPGLGGLDVFKAEATDKGIGRVRSMGYPVNSPGDDFGLIIKGNSGYYTSNHNAAFDDIFSFTITNQKQLVLLAIDQKGKPLSNVQLESSAAGKMANTLSLAKMPATIDWNYDAFDKLKFTKRGYVPAELALAKTDFFKYIAGDTVKVVMAKKAAPAGNRLVQVTLVDEEGNAILGGKLDVTDLKAKTSKQYNMNPEGFAKVTFSPNKSYQVKGFRQGFHDGMLQVSAAMVNSFGADEEIILKMRAKELFNTLKVGETIEMVIEYDLDKADIRPTAAQTLDKLVAYMVKYPSVKVELGAHTDSRGSDNYNQELSERRAQAAAAYIVSKGISADRLVAVGYGERKLKIANAVTEEQHQANRRTTVKIIANDGGATSKTGTPKP